jgi:hypothetical protein
MMDGHGGPLSWKQTVLANPLHVAPFIGQRTIIEPSNARVSTSMMGQAIVMMRQQMMSQPPLHGCKVGSSPAPAAGCKVFSLRLWCRVQGTPALKDGKGKTKETKRKRLWSCAVFEGPLWWKTERAKQRRQRGNDFSTCHVRGTPVLEDGKGKTKEMTGIDFDVLPLGAVSHTSTWHLVSPPVRAPARGQFDSAMTNTGQFGTGETEQ